MFTCTVVSRKLNKILLKHNCRERNTDPKLNPVQHTHYGRLSVHTHERCLSSHIIPKKNTLQVEKAKRAGMQTETQK